MDSVTYLAIAGGCALFYLLSLLFGGDHDVHHDFSGDGHSVEHDSDGQHDGGNIVKEFFSIRSILLFGLGFGAVGAIGSELKLGFVLIQLLAVASGIFFAWIGIKIFRFLRNQDVTTTTSMAELEGLSGRITTTIPTGGVGEVLIRDMRGEMRYLRVRSEDGESITNDQNVEVVSVAAGDLVVRKVNTLPRNF